MTLASAQLPIPYCHFFRNSSLGPDNKIYGPIVGFDHRHNLFKIDNPDDTLPNLRIDTTYLNFFTDVEQVPIFPNFRLGPIDNSPCDTLGISNPVSVHSIATIQASFEAYPSPTNRDLYIDIPEQVFPARVYLYNIMGQICKQEDIISTHTYWDISGQSPGIYELVLESASGARVAKRLVFMRE
jgi:hypothetical protein